MPSIATVAKQVHHEQVHDNAKFMRRKTSTLRRCDEYVKQYALKQLTKELEGNPFADYILLMVRCHFGSVETDELLTKHNCYPRWM